MNATDPRSRKSERGSVTAETAVVMPVLVVFTLSLCWLLSLGVAQVRLVDTSRDAARALARGDDRTAVREQTSRASPGSRVEMRSDGALVTVTVSEQVSPPSWLLVPLPEVTLRAQSSVLSEADDAPS